MDMNLVKFMGAAMTEDEHGERDYVERGPIWINPEMVAGVYDHTILISGHKIRVMESSPEIVARITR